MSNYEDKILETECLDEIYSENSYLNSSHIEKGFENDLLNHALHYANSGYPVILLHNLVNKNGKYQCSCQAGINCSYSGKHPRTRNGLNDATTDENIIIDWWDKYPQGNIGLLTGETSGIFVLDIDKKTDVDFPYNGEEALEIMQEDYKSLMGQDYSPLPATLTAVSGSGSRHLYFQYDLDFEIPTSISKIGQGIDIKSDGGYIVAAPSNHKSGNYYKWFGTNTPIEKAPIWLLYEIQNAIEVKAPSKSATKKTKTKQIVSVGGRDLFIFENVCGLLNSFPKDEVLARALNLNEKWCAVPLAEEEVTKIVNWSWEKYAKNKESSLGLAK